MGWRFNCGLCCWFKRNLAVDVSVVNFGFIFKESDDRLIDESLWKCWKKPPIKIWSNHAFWFILDHFLGYPKSQEPTSELEGRNPESSARNNGFPSKDKGHSLTKHHVKKGAPISIILSLSLYIFIYTVYIYIHIYYISSIHMIHHILILYHFW